MALFYFHIGQKKICGKKTYFSHLAIAGISFSFSSIALLSSSLWIFLYSAPILFNQIPLGFSSINYKEI